MNAILVTSKDAVESQGRILVEEDVGLPSLLRHSEVVLPRAGLDHRQRATVGTTATVVITTSERLLAVNSC